MVLRGGRLGTGGGSVAVWGDLGEPWALPSPPSAVPAPWWSHGPLRRVPSPSRCSTAAGRRPVRPRNLWDTGFGWLWALSPPLPCHQTSCRSPSPHTCTATSLGQRLPAHARVPLRAQTAHQPGCSHRCGQHRTGALGVDAGWSPRGCRGQGTTPAESPLRGTPMHLS